MFTDRVVHPSVFDRSDLRIIRKAYELAKQSVAQAGLAEVDADVAKLVFGVARDARKAGRSLKAENAAELLASQASSALLMVQAMALCA